MKRFIFTERGGIYIIDLQQTQQLLDEAYAFAHNIAERGGTVLFVGTKKQAQDAVASEAGRVGMPYVNHRWLGGLLTNWRTIADRIQRLHELRAPRRRPARPAPGEGAHRDDGRAREARGEPRRCRRHAPPARRGLHRRPAQGAARRARGAPARAAGDRARRHELRPRRGRLRHPGQRRRDPLVLADRPRDRRRRSRPASRRSTPAEVAPPPAAGAERAAAAAEPEPRRAEPAAAPPSAAAAGRAEAAPSRAAAPRRGAAAAPAAAAGDRREEGA